MTVALLLAAAPDRLSAMAHQGRPPGDGPAAGAPWLDFMGDRLMSAGVRQVDVAICADAADGLRAVAVTARDTGEPVLVCTSAGALATRDADLAALLGGPGTTALPADGALLVARKDLPAVADAAEALAARIAADAHPPPSRRSIRHINRRTRVSGDLDTAVESLIESIARRGVPVASLPATNGAPVAGPAPGRPAGGPAPPAGPGLVAEIAVREPARRLARWAAAWRLGPATLATTALALSVCAAAWYAAGSRSSLLIGSALLCAALPVRQASASAATAFGNWLGAVSGLAGEFAVYAGLAAGWTAARPHQAWEFATAARVVLAVRQTADGCYALVAGSRPDPPGRGHRLLRLAGQSIALPAGERTVLIAVTAAVGGPRTALTVLIGWGAVALGYALAERGVASRALVQAAGGPAAVTAQPGAAARGVVACRDDGPLAIRLGGVVRGQLPPLLPAIAGVTVTVMLAAAGLRNLPGLLLLAPAAAMLLAALGAGNPHTGRFDWLVPPLLQGGQYVYLAAVGFAAGVPAPVTYALIAAIALHHADVLHRQQPGMPVAGLTAAGLGWEGRMLVAGLGGMLGIETLVYVALAGYLWVLFGWDGLTGWLAEAGGGSR